MGGIGAPELLIVLVVVLVLFGGAKLPKLARSMGQASREFKKGINDDSDDEPEAASGDSAGSGDSGSSDRVTMTKAELEALMAEREAKGRNDAPPNVSA